MKRRHEHIHFVGVKGVGMTPLAIIAKEAGVRVSGCDVSDVFITDIPLKKAGITPQVGFDTSHLEGVSTVITTGAHHGFGNQEVIAAKERGIPVLSQGEAVGAFMEGKYVDKRGQISISIAGTHGKTTTTGLITTILKENGLDPSYAIGTSNIPSLGLPGHFGKGRYFVVEADEYVTDPEHDQKAKFLWQHPQIAVITNIELDHPDVYTSVDEIVDAFRTFVGQIQKSGLLVICGDNPHAAKILSSYTGRYFTYGFSPSNQFVIKRVSVSATRTFFWVESGNTTIGEFALSIPGEHNALNALAAIIIGIECGLSIEKIKRALIAYTGSKRRLELIGQLPSGALVYDDYAHHPTEIKVTLQTVRKLFPKKNIICIFQPHTYKRTKALFEDFTRSFPSADSVIITEVYRSLREMGEPIYSAELLVTAIQQVHKNTQFLASLSDVVEYLLTQKFTSNDVIIAMGAGDIYKVLQKLPIQKI